MSRRIRRTPYTDRVEAHGVRGFSVVNHMLLPKAYGPSVEEDYWHLREHVQIWDVACQRQVEICGRDAAKLVQMMTPRDLRKARIGQGLYIPMIDETAGMLNDPVLQKLDEASCLSWHYGEARVSDAVIAKGPFAFEDPDAFSRKLPSVRNERVLGNAM